MPVPVRGRRGVGREKPTMDPMPTGKPGFFGAVVGRMPGRRAGLGNGRRGHGTTKVWGAQLAAWSGVFMIFI